MLIFKVFCNNGYSGCGIEETLQIEESDLEDVPQEEWADYVWNTLGGREAIFDNVDMGCYFIKVA